MPVRLLACLAAAACAGPPDGVVRPDGAPLVPVEGGTIDTGCGYAVTTPYGVSRPEWGSDQAGDDPTPHQVHLGLAGDPATSIVVTWRTRDDATLASDIEYGAGDALDQHANGLTWVYYPYGTGVVRIHEAHLCGLEPDSAYGYRVGGAGASVRRFRTAPAAGADAAIVVGVLGDTRDGWDVWRAALEQLDATAAPDLLVFTGDAVDKAIDQNEWNRFFAMGEEVLSRVPLLAVMGNHEDNDAVFFAQLALPGDEDTYAIDDGPLHLTVLNDLPPDVNDVAGRIADFLDADLAGSAGAPWHVVAHHRPMWSSARFHGSAEELRAAWGSSIDAHAVDLVVNGHDHDYERTWPLRGETRVAPGQGTVYVVTGGAGADLYESGSEFFTAVSESVHHVVTLDVRPGSLRLRASRLDGSLLDELTMTK